jgi:hypothetical protein
MRIFVANTSIKPQLLLIDGGVNFKHLHYFWVAAHRFGCLGSGAERRTEFGFTRQEVRSVPDPFFFSHRVDERPEAARRLIWSSHASRLIWRASIES